MNLSEAQKRLLDYFQSYEDGMNLGPTRGADKFIGELRPAFSELLDLGFIEPLTEFVITEAGRQALAGDQS